MKKTWVKNTVIALVALAMVFGLYMAVGENTTLAAAPNVSNKTFTDLTPIDLSVGKPAGETWTYALVDSNGTALSSSEFITLSGSTVTPVKNGTAYVKITNQDAAISSSNWESTRVTITVNIDVSINFTLSEISIAWGATYDLGSQLQVNPGSVSWSSSNTGIVSVTDAGSINGKTAGTATITATSKINPARTATITVKVTSPSIKVNQPSPASIAKAGDTATITADLTPNGSPTIAFGTPVLWESSDNTIATVSGTSTNFDAAGRATATITGVKTGNVTITCRSGVAGAGGVYGTYSVTVGNPTPVITLSLNPNDTALGKGEYTYMTIHVDNPTYADVKDAAGNVVGQNAYVKITRQSRRVYVEEYNYSHPSTFVYWATLDASGNARVLVKPQYSGTVKLTVEHTGAAAKAVTFTVSGYPTLPQTGQDFTLIYALGACCLAAAAAWVIVYAKKKKHNAA